MSEGRLTSEAEIIEGLRCLGYNVRFRILFDVDVRDLQWVLANEQRVILVFIPWTDTVGHWAGFFNVHGKLHYFSSLGSLPGVDILQTRSKKAYDFIEKLKKFLFEATSGQMTFNERVLQGSDSFLCGNYLLLEAAFLIKYGKPLESLNNYTDKDLKSFAKNLLE